MIWTFAPLYLWERGRGEGRISRFGFRISSLNFGFVWDFEFRISDFPTRG